MPARRALAVAGVLLWAAVLAGAAEYHASPAGDDANPGTEAKPFATLQKGVDLLQPGDTLVVAPGVYRQCVRIGKLFGEPDRPITIRAAVPRTAFLIGSVTVTGWTRTPGTRNTWHAALDSPASLAYERDTNREYMELADLHLVDEQAGTFACDGRQRRIYVHTSDSAPPTDHRIDACVLPVGFDALSGGPADWEIPLRKHLVIAGFVLEGFSRAGVHIMRGDSCEVRDCVAHHCGAGVFMHSSIRSAIRRCEASWCYDRNDNEGGGIAFRGRCYDDVIEDCVVHDIVKYGIRHYAAGFLGCAIRGSLAYRVGRCAIHTKGAPDTERTYAAKYASPPSNEPLRVERNVAVVPAHPHTVLFDCWGMRHNTVGGLSNSNYRLGMDEKRETQLAFDPAKVEEQRFADPGNHDFRLQSDSPHRDKGVGAFEYRGDVFFVKPDGDDRGQGTAMSAAWRDASKALARLAAGQTLYLAAGRYAVSARLRLGGGVVAMRARGNQPVVFDGTGVETALTVEGPGRLEVRGVRFSGYQGPAIAAGKGVSLFVEKCVFERNAAAANVADAARFHKCVFHENGCGVRSAPDARAFVYGCVFSGRGPAYGGARVVSEFNLFAGPVATQVAVQAASLDAWRAATGQDRESLAADARFRDAAAGDYRLAPDAAGRGSGWLWNPVGVEDTPHHWFAAPGRPVFEDVGPRLLTPTTANLTWRTRGARSTAFVRYGLSPDRLDNLVQRDAGQHLGNFHAVSLFDLKPATTYHYQVGSGPYRMLFATHLATPMEGGEVVWDAETRSFTTPASFTPKRRTFHVSKARGDDGNDGLSAERPWASLHKASAAAEPGDRVIVGEGEYFGLLRPVNSGLPDAPIVFEAAPGERVELSGKRLTQPVSALILDKRHVVIRGFVFKEHCKMLQDDVGGGGQIVIGDSRDVRVERCLFDGRMYYMMSVHVFRSGDVRFSDNVIYSASNYTGLVLGMNTGPVTFDHNTFYFAGTSHGQIGANAQVAFTNNIFGEKMRVKWGQPGFSVWDNRGLVFDRNYYAFDDANTTRYALRVQPAESKEAVDCRGPDPLAEALRIGLEANGRVGTHPWAQAEEIRKKSATVRGVLPAEQDLKPLEFSDFVLRPDALCRGMAEGGGDPGARPPR